MKKLFYLTAAMALLARTLMSMMIQSHSGLTTTTTGPCPAKSMELSIPPLPALQLPLSLQKVIDEDYTRATNSIYSGKETQASCTRLLDLAERYNHAKSQWFIGTCYKNDIKKLTFEKTKMDIESRQKRAFTWFKKAADNGLAEAQNDLGLCYEHGTGVLKDEKLAVNLYKLAAAKKLNNAQFNLGRCYQHGIGGVERNEQMAVAYYLNAAEQGNAEAQFRLGCCLELGIGIEKNIHDAVAWYQSAADRGHTKAQFILAWYYKQGIGVPKDQKNAVKLYTHAAKHGHKLHHVILPDAQHKEPTLKKNQNLTSSQPWPSSHCTTMSMSINTNSK